jgi:N-acetyl-gamma-glutamyl-phosphate reductase
MVRVGIFGATGYTGLEPVRLLWRRPDVEIAFATSESSAGENLATVVPTLPNGPDLTLIHPDEAPLDAIDVVVLCLPQGAAAEQGVLLISAGGNVLRSTIGSSARRTAGFVPAGPCAQWLRIAPRFACW